MVAFFSEKNIFYFLFFLILKKENQKIPTEQEIFFEIQHSQNRESLRKLLEKGKIKKKDFFS